MCYNVLCDKYCTRQQYGYCPSWALNWEYRKKGIMEEIRNYNADIISLQVWTFSLGINKTLLSTGKWQLLIKLNILLESPKFYKKKRNETIPNLFLFTSVQLKKWNQFCNEHFLVFGVEHGLIIWLCNVVNVTWSSVIRWSTNVMPWSSNMVIVTWSL